MEEDLKKKLQRSKFLRDNTRPNKAVFTDENDHNPQVLEFCQKCGGRQQICKHFVDSSGEGYVLEPCDACEDGFTGNVVPYFKNVAPAMAATPNDKGWINCPGCNWRFTLSDKGAFTGARCRRCGQKIRLNSP